MSEQTFLLPDLGEGPTEAEIVRWLIAEGDTVAVDQPVVEVETAKSAVEVPTPYAGRVITLHGTAGDTLEVGKPLLTVGAADTAPAARLSGRAADTCREEERAGSGSVLIGYGTPSGSGPARRRRPRTATVATVERDEPPARPPSSVPLVASPLVRRLARLEGVELAAVRGTGDGGMITRADVQNAIDTPAPIPAPRATEARGERRVPLTGFRKAVSATLSRSRAEIPEATVWVDVDATPLAELREHTRTAQDPGPGLLAYLARFVVAGLRQYPVLNACLDTERQEIVEYDHINLGIAVQTERGLVVPAVAGAESMTTTDLDREIRRLTADARAGRATAQELSRGTFTLNNYGSFNVDGSAAIINHPQVAILGFGRIIDRPWVVDGELRARKIMQMSFVFDHRVCDGGTAAGFLRAVADAIENPVAAIARL